MKRILLLLDDEDQHQKLSHWLSEYVQVTLPAEQLATDYFDLCILDEVNLSRSGQWIEQQQNAASPAFLPFLYLAQSNFLDFGQPLDVCYDDLIMSPVRPVELKARIQSLLLTRHLSQQYLSAQEIIVRTSKAIESTSDAISIADIKGAALYHNQAFLDLYGFTVNEINTIGIPNALFVDSQIATLVYQTILQGKTWNGEVLLKTKTGVTIPTLLRADSIENETGRRIGLISVYTDITERKLVEAVQREQRVMAEALRDTAAALTSTLNLDEVLDRILGNVGQVVPHDAANIMLVEDGQLRIVRFRGYQDLTLESQDLTALRLPVANMDILGWMIETGKPVATSDLSNTRAWSDVLQTSMLHSYAGSPIHLGGKVIGFINLGSMTTNFYHTEHAERLQAFAEQAAIAIQNARLHEKAQTLAAYEERQRLARDLHDAVSQTLFSASVIAEALPYLWDRDPEKVRPRLVQLHKLTRGAMAEMRTLLMELRPNALLEASLDDLLRQLTEAVMGRARLTILLEMQELQMPLPEDVKVSLYYIAQETLRNIIKHARATEVLVTLETQHDGLRLKIEDNGRGFDASAVSSTSLGLRILHERAQQIDALLNITTEVGCGTTVTVDWSEKTKEEGLI